MRAAYRILLTTSLLLPAVATVASAQRIGFEGGLAGIENYDEFTPALGLSLSAPVTDRFRASLSYAQWVGCDNNAGCDAPRVGYGNRGINAVGLFRVLGGSYNNASLGAGVGWYERFRLRSGESERYWENAFTFSGELRRAVAYNSSVYLRGDVSVPDDDAQPRWSGLRVGVDVGGPW